jgi:predicted outer membrane repeat protein
MWRTLWPRSRQKAVSRRPASYRPRIEVLEDRCLPSTLIVTSTADSGPGSLRAEIAAAQSGDTIVFDSSLADQAINLTSGELVINKSLTIEGGAGIAGTISGSFAGRAFDVTSSSATVTLDNLRIEECAASDGGAIMSVGFLTLNNCLLLENTAPGTLLNRNVIRGGAGGAIDNLGTMAINNTGFDSNYAAGDGGAIENKGSMTVFNSNFGANEAVGNGGAIDNHGILTVSGCFFSFDASGKGGGEIANFGTASLTGSTISLGFATFGGGVFNQGTMIISNSTISNFFGPNIATDGGGIFNAGTLTLSATTVSGNGASGEGGGIYNAGTLYVTNGSTVCGNTAPVGADLYNLGTLFISNDSEVCVIGP